MVDRSAPPRAPPPAVAKPVAPRPVKRVAKKAKKKPVKVVICHRGRTVKVLKSNVRKHRKHGDKLGACRKPRKRR
jgi:hypothetical protein